MKDIDKRLTHIINEMNDVITDMSRMVVDSMIHISNQDNDIEDLKLQVQAAERDFEDIRADYNIINKQLVDVRKIIKDNVVITLDEDGDNVYLMNLDSRIDRNAWDDLMYFLNLTEEDIESND